VATFAASVAEFLDKDLRVVQDVAAEIGSDLGAIEPALTALERLVEAAGAAPRPRHTPVEPGSRRNDRVPTPSPLRPIG
jgi:hypothetical protein